MFGQIVLVKSYLTGIFNRIARKYYVFIEFSPVLNSMVKTETLVLNILHQMILVISVSKLLITDCASHTDSGEQFSLFSNERDCELFSQKAVMLLSPQRQS